MNVQRSSGVSAVVLGIMQDAGLPHIGCRCTRCVEAFDHPERAGRAACLALIDERSAPARVWLIDATPDIGHQLNDLAPILGPHPRRAERICPPDGIFLTHGHMGHIGGLPQLGPEGMAVAGLPVYASEALAEVIRGSAVWRPLMGGLTWRDLSAGVSVALGPSLNLTPLAVPHRDEWGAGTFAFLIEGPSRSLLYVPDIDSWEQWPEAREVVASVDVALVDATFYSAAELGGSATGVASPIAHPLVPDTLAFFGDLASRLVLIHLNHTNPALDEGSLEQTNIRSAGAAIARQGQPFLL